MRRDGVDEQWTRRHAHAAREGILALGERCHLGLVIALGLHHGRHDGGGALGLAAGIEQCFGSRLPRAAGPLHVQRPRPGRLQPELVRLRTIHSGPSGLDLGRSGRGRGRRESAHRLSARTKRTRLARPAAGPPNAIRTLNAAAPRGVAIYRHLCSASITPRHSHGGAGNSPFWRNFAGIAPGLRPRRNNRPAGGNISGRVFRFRRPECSRRPCAPSHCARRVPRPGRRP